MDYCSSCRRHLNGALVCPGCGAYAPDIAPEPVPVPIPAPAPPRSAVLAPEPAPMDHGEPATSAITPVTPPLAQGRAARRRQLARLRKSQRRAVLATAVALVGGGLTLSTMDRGGSGDRAQAATAPETTTGMGGADREVTEPTVTDPAPDTRSADTPRSSRATPPRTAEPAPLEATPTTATPPSQRTAAAARDPRPQTQQAAPPSAITTPPPTTAPAPDPDPTTPQPTPPASTPAPAQPPAAETPADRDNELCLLVICLGG
ncbi:hypothetical protein AB0D49_32495 [Streptomyces sp. NPDC048290]|uniref:SCO2400 family protein n=1 Tax=Streptomyces sp. NPDC048290 TaxID=3155811 RepID=UPI00343709E0